MDPRANIKEVAKVLIRSGESYLFSRKRAPGRRSDGRLEMFGGTLASGETPFEALLREAGEEELTGGLVQELRRQTPTFVTVLVQVSGQPEPQHLFEIRIEPATADGFVAHWSESHGVTRLPAAVFDSDTELSKSRRLFTPKSIAIFRAFGRSI